MAKTTKTKGLPREPIPLDAHLCFALYGATIAINRTYKPMLDAMGITYTQYLVLTTLWEAEALTIGAIAERLSLEPSTITPLVKRLEATGLVERHRVAGDDRRVELRLTPKGRALRAETRCLAEAILEKSGMSVEEIGALTKQVKRFRDALAAAEVAR